MKQQIFLSLLLFLVLLVSLSGCKTQQTPPQQQAECTADSDCVAAACCHATACTTKDKAPKCEGVMCTMDCRGGTLDCGGSCTCEQGKCTANYADLGI